MIAQTIDRLLNPRTNTVSAWRDRALELAETHGLLNTGRGVKVVRLAESSAIVSLLVRVASQTQAEMFYDVRYDLADDTATCACQAARWGKPCAHAGAALRYGRYVRALYTAEARAEAERMAGRDLAHEENAAALGY